MATAYSSPSSLLLKSLSSLNLSQSLPPQTTLSKPSLPPPQILKHKHPITPILPTHPLSHDLINVLCPALANSNTLFFKSAYNIQIIVGEHEDADKLVDRFSRQAKRLGIIRECKRRRYFETTQEKRKRKIRDAARRNSKRRPIPKAPKQDDSEAAKKVKDEEDNWDFIDVDLPYSL